MDNLDVHRPLTGILKFVMGNVEALLLLVLACSGTTVAGSLLCYECTNVANISDCHTSRECPPYHSCFTSVIGQGSSAVFTLGCRHSDRCPSTHQLPAGNTIVGRAFVSAACNQCCNVDACNRNMCSMSTHASNTDTDTCEDDPTFDCSSVAAHINICAVTDQAITVCRKFCGLCSRNGSRSAWGQWSNCDLKCGSGHMTRLRTCTNPAPAHGGLDCVGRVTDNKPCIQPLCPVHGAWTLWSPWGSCSATCGVGLRRRDRSCTNPYPAHGGDNCIGDDRDDKVCMDQPCADGAWTAWGAWVHCSTSCGPGFKTRTRSCTNPPPSPFGHDCVGLMQGVVACNNMTCPVIHGGWSSWSRWSTCTWIYGTETRTRTCTNPAPSATGRGCIGNSEVTRNAKLCLVNGTRTSGRVEILVNGMWGTVCHHYFIVHNEGATVVCRMLGYSSGTLAEAGHFGAGTGPILLDDIFCRGTESDIMQCPRLHVDQNSCSHILDVGVICA